MMEAFHVWRQVIKVKDAKSKSENVHGPGGEAFGDITSTLAAVAIFEKSFRPFMNSCAEHFGILSDISRKFFGMHISCCWLLATPFSFGKKYG